MTGRPDGKFPFDEKCLDLADYFLRDIPRCSGSQIRELAEIVQITVEDFISSLPAIPPPPSVMCCSCEKSPAVLFLPPLCRPCAESVGAWVAEAK